MKKIGNLDIPDQREIETAFATFLREAIAGIIKFRKIGALRVPEQFFFVWLAGLTRRQFFIDVLAMGDQSKVGGYFTAAIAKKSNDKDRDRKNGGYSWRNILAMARRSYIEEHKEMSASDLARDLGLSGPRAVRQILSSIGTDCRGGKSGTPASQDKRMKVLRICRCKPELSDIRIGEILGISDKTVQKYRLQEGLRRDRSGKVILDLEDGEKVA